MKKICLCLFVLSALACKVTDEMTPKAMEARLQPIGAAEVPVDGAKLVQVAAGEDVPTGERVYNQACMVCHAAGVAGAPKLGDKAAWEARAAKGMETLMNHVINGFNAMPARGTCMSCSDDELRASVEWMIEQSK